MFESFSVCMYNATIINLGYYSCTHLWGPPGYMSLYDAQIQNVYSRGTPQIGQRQILQRHTKKKRYEDIIRHNVLPMVKYSPINKIRKWKDLIMD